MHPRVQTNNRLGLIPKGPKVALVSDRESAALWVRPHRRVDAANVTPAYIHTHGTHTHTHTHAHTHTVRC